MPDHIELGIGSIVRVPLSGRRVRGWVVEISHRPDDALKEIAGVSGAVPVFDSDLLRTLTWAAQHYVAPLAVLLERAAPPRLPRAIPSAVEIRSAEPSGPLSAIAQAAASGQRRPPQAVVGRWQSLDWLSSLTPVVAAGRSVVVVTATAEEAGRIAGRGRELLGDAIVAVVGESDADITRAWEEAQAPGKVLVGTPRVATWSVGGLGMAVVLEEGRRAMKDRQTPTLHVREVMRTRSMVEGFVVVFLGPTPSVEVLSAGAQVTRLGNRAWPLVEVVDRSAEPPGAGYLSESVVAALRAMCDAGRPSFVFTHRRIAMASMRCTRCRTLKECGRCGQRVGREGVCRRCGSPVESCRVCGGTEFEEMGTIPERLVTEINRRLGPDVAGVYPEGKTVWVGTERDLAGLPPVALTVAADVDGMLLGSGYRSSEEALRQLARLANALEAGPGRRMMLQTSRPDTDLVVTLRRGDPIPYLRGVLEERAREGMPPSTEMLAVEVRGELPPDLESDLESLEVAVLGPVTVQAGRRWLLQGDLRKTRLMLRPMVGRWRESGATVRIDADPIDL